MRKVPTASPAQTVNTIRPRQRPRADSELRVSQLTRRATPSETGHLFLNGPSLGRPQKEINRRSALSEVSSLMPSIPNPRDMQMLFHEHPPSHYAPSSIAESDTSRPSSPILPTHLTLGQTSISPSASFSFYHADDAASSSGGSLKLRLEDELHLADLVSMGPASDDDESESVF